MNLVKLIHKKSSGTDKGTTAILLTIVITQTFFLRRPSSLLLPRLLQPLS
jgi:hypothetical protein